MGIGAAGGIGAILGIIAIIKIPAVQFLRTPITRIILFGATAAVAWLAVGEIGEARKKLERDAKVYKKLADELEKRTNRKSKIEDGYDGPGDNTKMAKYWPENWGLSHQDPTSKNHLCGNANQYNKVTPSSNCNCKPNCRGTRVPRFPKYALGKNPFLAEYANTADSINQASKQIANGGHCRRKGGHWPNE